MQARWPGQAAENLFGSQQVRRLRDVRLLLLGNVRYANARTLGWWRTELARQRQGAVERALDEALAELHQRRFDAGQRRLQASKRAKQKDALELHRFHFTKLRRLGGDDALLRFAARLQAEQLLAFPACYLPVSQ